MTGRAAPTAGRGTAGEPEGPDQEPIRSDLPAWWMRALFLALCRLLRWMGPLRYVLADGVGTACYLTMRVHRRRAAANHRRANPPLGGRAANKLARWSFCEYARTSVDFLWAMSQSLAEVKAKTAESGLDTVIAEVNGGQGGVIALTHFGNWDMAANVAAAYRIPVTTVMAPVGRVTKFVIWARNKNGLEVFAPRHAARGLFRALRKGRCVALLCDIPSAGHTVDVRYCGGWVSFTSAPAWLARTTGCKIFPATSHRVNGVYTVTVFDPITVGEADTDEMVMQQVASALEPIVTRTPRQWYPFHEVYVKSTSSRV